ncbi:MAG TPA: hypothetical protein PLC15_19380, partial [Candidatus Obscuribacter sp.]|nr:hypothetical protein [Candidatus Obscuribacter sp.]
DYLVLAETAGPVALGLVAPVVPEQVALADYLVLAETAEPVALESGETAVPLELAESAEQAVPVEQAGDLPGSNPSKSCFLQ